MTTIRNWPAAALTALWPGFGHMHQGRTTRGTLIALWALAATLGWQNAAALGVAPGLFIAEMVLIGIVAFTDVFRWRGGS